MDEQKRIQQYFENLYKQGKKPWTQHPEEPSLSVFLKVLSDWFSKGAKVLDIGCGNGWISVKIAENGHKVWGLDSSSTAIAEAKQLAGEKELEKSVKFQVGDALDLPYKNEFFDALVDRGLFHHILPENHNSYMENILRVTKPHSLFYLSVFGKENPETIGQTFAKEEVEKLFGKNFKTIQYLEDEPSEELPATLLHFIFSRK